MNKSLQKVTEETEEIGEIPEKDLVQEIFQKKEKRKNHVLNKNSKSGKLNGDLLHWIYKDYDEHKKKIITFSSIAAKAYYDEGIKSSLFKIIFRPTWAFFKAYILRLGFLDGKNGWRICKQTFNGTYLKYYKLRQHWNDN
mgnify:CR=1 FL=1